MVHKMAIVDIFLCRHTRKTDKKHTHTLELLAELLNAIRNLALQKRFCCSGFCRTLSHLQPIISFAAAATAGAVKSQTRQWCNNTYCHYSQFLFNQSFLLQILQVRL